MACLCGYSDPPCLCFMKLWWCYFCRVKCILQRGESHHAVLGKRLLRTARPGRDRRRDCSWAAEVWLFSREASERHWLRPQTHGLPAGRWDRLHLRLQRPGPAGSRQVQEETRLGTFMASVWFRRPLLIKTWTMSSIRAGRGLGRTDYRGVVLRRVAHAGLKRQRPGFLLGARLRRTTGSK